MSDYMKNHHIMLGMDDESRLKEVTKNTKLWSDASILDDEKICHYHITKKWGTYLFSKLNKKQWGHVMDQLGYENESQLPSAQKFLSNYVADDEVTFFNIKNYNFGKARRNQFIDLIKRNRFLSEWIRPDQPRRVYFDIDGLDILDDFISAINDKFSIDEKLPKIAISGSYGYKLKNGKFTEEKYHSYHIVLPDFYFPDLKSMVHFKRWASSIGGDSAIYIRNSKFKCINQKKPKEKDDRLQKIIMDDNPEHHCVQILKNQTDEKINLDTDEWSLKFKEGLDDEHISEVNQNMSQRRRNRGSTGINEIVPINVINPPTLDIHKQSAMEIVMLFLWKPGYKLPRQVWRNILRWLSKREHVTYDEFREWDKLWEEHNPGEGTSEATYDEIFNVPEEEWFPCSRYQIRDYLTKHYGVELKSKFFEEHKDQFLKRGEEYKGIKPVIVKGKHVTLDYVNGGKYQLICVSMGGGKTELVLRYIKSDKSIEEKKRLIKELAKRNPGKTFCFVVVRITQGSGIMGRTNEKELDVYLYSDAKKEKHIILPKKDRLCIEAESLHHIINCQYDYLILDEMESLRETFQDNECHGVNYTKNYWALVNLIRKAQKVFVMDAYLHKWTIDWLQMIDKEAHPVNDFNLIMRSEKYDLIKKRVIEHTDKNIIEQCAVDDLKAGRKVYIQYPYASGTTKDEDIISFTQSLLERAGLKPSQGLCYFGKLDSNLKKRLSAVNDTWSVTEEVLEKMREVKLDKTHLTKGARIDEIDPDDLIKLVVVNTCVTVGVNYDKVKPESADEIDFRFDKVYLLYADFISARQCIQSSMRPRHTKLPIINLYHFPNWGYISAIKKGLHYESPPPFRPTLEGDEPDHFKCFLKSIHTEFKANGLPMLKYFMRSTGYTIEKSTKTSIPGYAELCKEAYLEYQRNRTDVNNFDFDKAESIDYIRYQELDSLVRSNESTFAENLSVVKFNVQRHFTDKYQEACSVFWKKPKILKSLLVLVYNDQTFRSRLVSATGYQEDTVIMKDKEIRRLKNVYEKAVIYNEDEREFQIREDPLTDEDKLDIHSSLVLQDVEKDFNYFKVRSDIIIRKRIIVTMFGKSCLAKVKKGKLSFRDERSKLDEISERCLKKVQSFNCKSKETERITYNKMYSAAVQKYQANSDNKQFKELYLDTAINGFACLNKMDKSSLLDGTCHIEDDSDCEYDSDDDDSSSKEYKIGDIISEEEAGAVDKTIGFTEDGQLCVVSDDESSSYEGVEPEGWSEDEESIYESSGDEEEVEPPEVLPSQFDAWKAANPDLWSRLVLCLYEDIEEKRKHNKNWNDECEFYLQRDKGSITGVENLENVTYSMVV